MTGLPIESQTVSQMVDKVMAQPEGTRLYLLAPIARGRKGEYKRELNDLMRKGFLRAKIDGTFWDLEDAPSLDKKLKHDIEVVVDRIVVGPDIAARLAESFETALKLADGIAFAEVADDKGDDGEPRRLIFSEKFADPVSGFTIPEIEPRLFSFNNPYGACPACDGLGTEAKIDPNLIVPDTRRCATAPSSPVEDERALLPADAKRSASTTALTGTRGGSALRGAARGTIRHRQDRDHLRL